MSIFHFSLHVKLSISLPVSISFKYYYYDDDDVWENICQAPVCRSEDSFMELSLSSILIYMVPGIEVRSTDFAVSIVLAELSVSLALSVTFYKSFLFGWTWIESHMLFGRGSETAAVSSLWAADMVHLPFFV